jgi:hypothetical protein
LFETESIQKFCFVLFCFKLGGAGCTLKAKEKKKEEEEENPVGVE